ncbi:MAG: transcriptional repressor [Ignavibacteria bacterium]|nr:transcriptional repressor [Ignavibacteria bacterium]
MANNADVEQLAHQFAEFLKKKKYRNTQERNKVIERIAELDEHFNADELYLYMNAKGDKVSRATIYSTLDLLTQCHILMKHRFQGESAHFELASRMPNHDHLICVECGRIVEFREKSIDAISVSVSKEFGFKRIRHSLQVFAVCHDPTSCEHNTQD